MLFCNQKIIAYTNDKDQEIGFLDIYNYLKNLLNNNDRINISEKIIGQYNLRKYDNLSEEEIKEKIFLLKEIFYKRNKEIKTKLDNLKNLKIILNRDLINAEEQLDKITKILGNKNFTASIKLIQNKFQMNIETENDIMIYSFYQELEKQKSYLKNFKIGSMQQYIDAMDVKRTNILNAKKIIHNYKTEYKNKIKKNIPKNIDLNYNNIIDNITDIKTKEIINKLNKNFEKKMGESNINLKGKVLLALKNFLNITIPDASLIMKDKKFRIKLFRNLNIESIINKINHFQIELNEHNIINNVLDREEKQKQIDYIQKITANKKEQRLPGFEGNIPFINITTTQIQKKIDILQQKNNLIKSLNKNYEYLKNNLLSEEEYNKIGQLIIQKVNQNLKEEELKTKKNKIIIRRKTQEIKYSIKIDVAKIIIDKYITKSPVRPMSEISTNLSNIFKNMKDVVKFENIFKNIIMYETDKPFIIIKKLFNSMIDILTSIKDVHIKHKKFKKKKRGKDEFNPVIYTFKNLLYKTTPKYVKEKNKRVLKEEFHIQTINLSLLLSYMPENNIISKELIELIEKNLLKNFKPKNKKNIEKEQKEYLNTIFKDNLKENKLWTWVKKENFKTVLSTIENTLKFISFSEYIFEPNTLNYRENIQKLILLIKDLNTRDLKNIKKSFNQIFDMIYNLYKIDVIPHDLNKLEKTREKSFNDLKREYFLGLIVSLFMKYTNNLYNLNRTELNIEYINNSLNVLNIFLNKDSKFLKNIIEKKVKKNIYFESEITENKDDLLNNFFSETIEDIDLETNDYDNNYENINQDNINDDEENDKDAQDYGDVIDDRVD